MKKCSSSKGCWDSNPRPSDCESHPITTRPDNIFIQCQMRINCLSHWMTFNFEFFAPSRFRRNLLHTFCERTLPEKNPNKIFNIFCHFFILVGCDLTMIDGVRHQLLLLLWCGHSLCRACKDQDGGDPLQRPQQIFSFLKLFTVSNFNRWVPSRFWMTSTFCQFLLKLFCSRTKAATDQWHKHSSLNSLSKCSFSVFSPHYR